MINIPSNVKVLLNILEKNKFDVFIVGGCVRDSIIGTMPYDWDICTNATPEQILNCFKDYKTIQNGKKHGTIGIILADTVYEITTYRLDGEYLDLRRPSQVFFTDSLREDLSRRDFTINSLAYNEKDGLIDYFGGVDDILNKTIRCVGNANKRFNEDALRILRALRLSSCIGFEIEKSTSDAIFANKDLLKNIGIERINTEFSKLVLGQTTSKVLRQYIEIIKIFIPQLSYVTDSFDKNIWEITLRAIEMSQPDIVIRLFFLLKEIPEVKEILKNLKYENKIILEILSLISNYKMKVSTTPQNIKLWLNKLGEKTLRQILLIRCIDFLLTNRPLDTILEIEEILNRIIIEKQCYNLKGLDINGEDLKNLGIKEGKRIGEILTALLMMVINDEIENKKEKLLKFARQML